MQSEVQEWIFIHLPFMVGSMAAAVLSFATAVTVFAVSSKAMSTKASTNKSETTGLSTILVDMRERLRKTRTWKLLLMSILTAVLFLVYIVTSIVSSIQLEAFGQFVCAYFNHSVHESFFFPVVLRSCVRWGTGRRTKGLQNNQKYHVGNACLLVSSFSNDFCLMQLLPWMSSCGTRFCLRCAKVGVALPRP